MRLVALVCTMLVLAGCTGARLTVRVAGSTSVQPVAEVLAEAYTRQGGAPVSSQGGGSTAGVQAVLEGVANVGAVSRTLTAQEQAQGLQSFVFAYDVLAVILHPDNPVQALTPAQLGAVYSGRVTDWRDLGGRPGAIHVLSREAGSGSREAFRSLIGPVHRGAIIQNSSGAIRVAVKEDPQAIGYVSLGVAQMGGVKALRVGLHRPTDAQYPYRRPLSFVVRPPLDSATAAFLRFALSPAGQALVTEEGLLPVR